MRKQRLGDLQASFMGGTDGQGGGDGPLVVLLHGFGAPGDDLVDLAYALQVPKTVRFVFPEAPLSLASIGYGAGRAWWMIDLEALERRARGERVDRSEERPAGLESAREQLASFLNELEQQSGALRRDMILGGFSQGSMLACEYVLHADTRPAGLVLLSSTLLSRHEWVPRIAQCEGLPVLQSHGHSDNLLPYADAETLRDLFEAAGADLTFVDFPGGHAIPQKVLDALSRFINARTRS